jgi:hypothetical protein
MTKTNFPIAVIFENDNGRNDAVRFCDELVTRFWSRCEFDISWLSFADLADQNVFRTTASKAAPARLVIFSMAPGCEVPSAVRSWIETWLAQRGECEGSIVGLRDPGHQPAGGVSHNFVYLRGIAHRAGLDYLTEVPEKLTHTIPDQLESYSERARQVTSVLDQILQRKPVPPAFRA